MVKTGRIPEMYKSKIACTKETRIFFVKNHEENPNLLVTNDFAPFIYAFRSKKTLSGISRSNEPIRLKLWIQAILFLEIPLSVCFERDA